MADNPSPGMDLPGGQDHGPGSPPPQPPPQPWFPPSEQAWSPPPAGPAQPPPGSSTGQPGWSYGQPGGAGQAPFAAWPAPATAPKPGVIPLRPLAVGEILDGAFTSIRRNPRATLGIAAVLLTIFEVALTIARVLASNSVGAITLPAAGQQISQAQINHDVHAVVVLGATVGGVYVIVGVPVTLLLTGLLTVVIGRLVLGRVISASEAWRIARSRLLALLGVSVLTGLATASPWVVLTGLATLLLVAGAPTAVVVLVLVLGFIASVCLMVLFMVKFWLGTPIVMLERDGPLASLGRAWRLVRGSFWRVFGIGLLTLIIVWVASAILQIPFNLLAALTGGPSTFGGGASVIPLNASPLSLVITAVGGIVVTSITQPILAGVAVLLYVDLRMRREGLDLVLQSAASGGVPSTGDEFASVWRPGARASAGGTGAMSGGVSPGQATAGGAASGSAGPGGTAPPPGAPPAW